MRPALAFGIVFALLGAACTTVEPGRLYHPDMTPYSEAELAQLRGERLEGLKLRGAMDLACPEDSVHLSCVNADVNGLCITGAVDGCAKHGSYLWTKTDADQSQWSLDAHATAVH